MPILPAGVTSPAAFKPPSGGSPRGWTFISTAMTCWYRWAQQHVFGLHSLQVSPALGLGSAYHAFMEGKVTAEVARDFPQHVDAASLLADRRKRGPPLPEGPDVVVEKEFPIFKGWMTSKPDRIEKHGEKVVVRDFKTASNLSEHDEENWNIDGGILGECMAAKTDTAVVDIIVKYPPKSGVGVKLVNVTLTPEKERVLRNAVMEFWREAEERTAVVARADPRDVKDIITSPKAFVQNLKGCVGKYGPCPYYARCWSKGKPESMFYAQVQPEWRWAKYKPAITWMKSLEAAYEKGRKHV